MTVLCESPAVAVTLAGVPEVLVKEKLAGLVTPLTRAATVYEPAVLLAVKVGVLARPDVLVAAVTEVPSPAKVPLAPEFGAVNVTVTPGTGLLLASVTVAWNCVVKAVVMVVLCGVPAVAVMLAAVDSKRP